MPAADFSRHPIGSGPFRFVSQAQDDEVIVERNPDYFTRPCSDGGSSCAISRVRFRVVPDAIVRALELRKGSADIEVSSLTPDIIPVLAKQPTLAVTERPGTNFTYLGAQSRRSNSETSRSSPSPRLRHRPRLAHPLSGSRPSARRQRHPPAQSLGLRTERHAIRARHRPRRAASRLRRISRAAKTACAFTSR